MLPQEKLIHRMIVDKDEDDDLLDSFIYSFIVVFMMIFKNVRNTPSR